MDLSQIIIVLSHPDSSHNIGSVCRAMQNAGLHQLRIIGKKEDYEENQVRRLSIHAFHVWESALFFDNVENATKDCILSAGTTRRKGKKRKPWLCYPEEFAENLQKMSDGKIAILFGNERTGLTDGELEDCSIGITIPVSKEFGSLNLSHAVQIITYSIFRAHAKKSPSYKPVSLERITKAIEPSFDSLKDSHFFKKEHEDTEFFSYWKSILSRASLSEKELQYFEKIQKKLTIVYKKESGKNDILREDD